MAKYIEDAFVGPKSGPKIKASNDDGKITIMISGTYAEYQVWLHPYDNSDEYVDPPVLQDYVWGLVDAVRKV